MKKTRVVILLIGLTLLGLCAGAAAGLLASRATATSAGTTTSVPPAPDHAAPLAEELALNPEQREQMRQIWEGVRQQAHEAYDDAQRLQKQRDDALVAMLSDEQKAQFEKISKDFADQFSDLEKKREQLFQDAVELTKKLLNEEQRRKYEQILKNRVPPGHKMGGPPMAPPPMAPPPMAPPPK